MHQFLFGKENPKTPIYNLYETHCTCLLCVKMSREHFNFQFLTEDPMKNTMIDHVWLEHFMIRLPSPLVLSNMPKTRLTWEWFIFTLRRLGLFISWSNKSWISVMVIINSNLFFLLQFPKNATILSFFHNSTEKQFSVRN